MWPIHNGAGFIMCFLLTMLVDYSSTETGKKMIDVLHQYGRRCHAGSSGMNVTVADQQTSIVWKVSSQINMKWCSHNLHMSMLYLWMHALSVSYNAWTTSSTLNHYLVER